jgi:DNA polymerase
MKPLSLDWETKSACDLPARGAWIYARDATTDILVGAWAFEGEEPVTWLPGESCPERVRQHIEAGGTVRAWNVMFEFEIWNAIAVPKYGFPPLKIEQVECVMAESYAMGLPGKLEKAAVALGLDERKDAKGARVMLQISKPREVSADGTIIWWDDAAKFETLRLYNLQDVRTEMAAGQRLMRLSADERALWQLDHSINARGLAVDIDAIDAGTALVEDEKVRLDEAMRAVTGNVVAGGSDVRQLTQWLRYRKVECKGVGAPAIVEILSRDDLPDDCRRALRIRQEAAKTSTAKLPSMRYRAAADNRMRGLFQYHGANTGRWAARGPQLQNVPRPSLLHSMDEIEDAIAHLGDPQYLNMFYGDPMTVVSDCLRSVLVAAPGHTFVCCDYSNIEGRVLPWLAGEEWKLEAFREYDRGEGPDLYLVAVSRGRRISIEASKPFRQEGKVEELAFQFGGGKGAMTTWCEKFGMQMADDEKELRKNRWRTAHLAIVRFWKQLETAAIRAVQEGGVHHAGPIAFKVKGSFLWCQLPSKRVLCYPFPQISTGTFGGPQLTYMYESINKQWVRGSTYGGSLAENVTQAVARDILVAGMHACEANGYPIVMHVHDEIVAEVSISAARSVDEMSTLMSNAPHWATGLPIAATGWTGNRYRKD